MTPELTEEDKAELSGLLKRIIGEDRFPFSDRMRRLKGEPCQARL